MISQFFVNGNAGGGACCHCVGNSAQTGSIVARGKYTWHCSMLQ